MTDGPDTPQIPARDAPDNDEHGTTEETGEGGYPEQSPTGTDADEEPQEGRPEQPQRDEA